jgi:hypothetical protein
VSSPNIGTPMRCVAASRSQVDDEKIGALMWCDVLCGSRGGAISSSRGPIDSNRAMEGSCTEGPLLFHVKRFLFIALSRPVRAGFAVLSDKRLKNLSERITRLYEGA